MSTETLPQSTVHACISCRLRRKKCDKTRPLCSRCQRLGIPAEWCIYRESVGLLDKDSSVTLAREKSRNRELKRQVEHHERVVGYLRRSQQSEHRGSLQEKSIQRRSSVEKILPEAPDVECYLGLISISASYSWEPVTTILRILSEEREKYISQKLPKQDQGAHRALEVFEEKCHAASVGAPVTDGSFLVQMLVNEVLPMVPNEAYYRFFWAQTRSQNKACLAAGVPYLHAKLIHAVENIVKFKQDGTPYLEEGIHKDGRKLVYLSMSLMILAIGYFVRSRRKDMGPSYPLAQKYWRYGLCIRYAGALLRASILDPSLDLEQSGPSILMTIALHQLHLFTRYTASTNYKSDTDNPQNTALYTRYLISRCKAHHFHQDLEKWYQDITEDEILSYKSVWYSLVMLEIVDTLDFGLVSSIQSDTFAYEAPAALRTPVCDAIRILHEVVDDMNVMDGELSLSVLMEAAEHSLKTVQKLNETLGSTLEEDMAVLREINPITVAADPALKSHFFSAGERFLIRTVIFGVMQSIANLVTRVLERSGETIDNSERAYLYQIRTAKYSVLGIKYMREFFELVQQIGKDPTNDIGHISVLAMLHFITPFESCGLRRAVLWAGNYVKKMTTLTDDETINFMLYSDESEEQDRAFTETLKHRFPHYIPTLEELMDFELDWDATRLKQKFGNLLEPRVLTLVFADEFVEVRRCFQSTPSLSLSFMKMTKAYAFGTRYISLGIRYFFPELVKGASIPTMSETPVPELQRTTESSTESSRKNSEDTEGDFDGTFREMFEQVIDTGSSKVFTFGNFLGGEYDQYLRDNWEDSFENSLQSSWCL